MNITKLKELKSIIELALENTKVSDPTVEFYIDKEYMQIADITQVKSTGGVIIYLKEPQGFN